MLQEEGETVCNIVHNYFVNLFTSEVGDHDLTILSDVSRCISKDINAGLLAPFSYEEVKKALFQIGDLKAPGPDGLHAVFFSKGSGNCWGILSCLKFWRQ
jgi:hypothetical protein